MNNMGGSEIMLKYPKRPLWNYGNHDFIPESIEWPKMLYTSEYHLELVIQIDNELISRKFSKSKNSFD